MAIIRTAAIFLLLAPTWAGGAVSTETFYPLIKYACDQQADILTVTNTILKGSEGEHYQYSDELGSYSPWDMVDIDRTSARAKIVKKRNIVKTCELSSGVYTVLLEPKPFGKTLDGRCGASISASITVTYDGIDILEKTAFEDYCHGNSPIITRVTTFGKTSEVKIKRIAKYKFY
jgi:hypothetical protein